MSLRTNLVLLVIAIGLSVYVFYFENTPAPWQ